MAPSPSIFLALAHDLQHQSIDHLRNAVFGYQVSVAGRRRWLCLPLVPLAAFLDLLEGAPASS
jgi:hypothetical protein